MPREDSNADRPDGAESGAPSPFEQPGDRIGRDAFEEESDGPCARPIAAK